MPLTENHEVVEAFATIAADQPLELGRLPWTPRRHDHVLDAHRLNPPTDVGARYLGKEATPFADPSPGEA